MANYMAEWNTQQALPESFSGFSTANLSKRPTLVGRRYEISLRTI